MGAGRPSTPKPGHDDLKAEPALGYRAQVDDCLALTRADALLRLLRSLEPTSQPVEGAPGKEFAGGLVVPLREDPGSHILYLVAEEAPSARADGGERWLKGRANSIEKLAADSGAPICTIVVPGSWPPRQTRKRVGPIRVRLVSAVHHLWTDRFRVHDSEGNVDETRRAALMQRLGGNWSEDEERRYTDPAIESVTDGDLRSNTAKEMLLRAQPDIPSGGVTVVYGPGGIGKTYFLRRVTKRMTRSAIAAPTQGIPLFAELPVLLHEDALETWISKQGIRLPLPDIRALIQAGVLVPVLDALDELVRGQAREGSRRFLAHIRDASAQAGKVLLSSRDYYLNLDPLVREELGADQPQLTIGFFSKAGRRRYVQMRTGLDEQDAAKWASRLEQQAQETLSGLAEADVESLIGHPLFLDALCQLIIEIPPERRAVESERFQLTSPDVFGDIVDRVLEREHDKVKPGWDAKFENQLAGSWTDPYTPEIQRRVFRSLVLLAAADGSHETATRQSDDARYRELRHGVFLHTHGVLGDSAPREALKVLVANVLGPPEVTEAGAADADEIAEIALDDFAGFLLQHTLADTRPNLPEDLVFATRHRAYFDYLLSEELLAELQRSLTDGGTEARQAFIEWCLAHHIFETQDGAEAPFATCLDFALWHRPAVDQSLAALEVMFEPGEQPDDILASYVVSLALAVAMRATARGAGVRIAGKDFAPHDAFELTLVESIVPAVARVQVTQCTFPTVLVQGIAVRDSTILDCDFFSLSLTDTSLIGVELDGVKTKSLEIQGAVRLTDCVLDLDEEDEFSLVVAPNATLTLTRCKGSAALIEQLEAAARVRPDAISLDCIVIERLDMTTLSSGRVFINRLMTLLRKHGHNEYAVWEPKLRGLTKATGATFPQALETLRKHGAVVLQGEMICLTGEAEKNLYSGKLREGLRSFEDVAAYWDPIVADLDLILGS